MFLIQTNIYFIMSTFAFCHNDFKSLLQQMGKTTSECGNDLINQSSIKGILYMLQWREVARELEGVIRFGAVNCGDEWQLCRMQGIHAYPSLMMYPAVSVILYLYSLIMYPAVSVYTLFIFTHHVSCCKCYTLFIFTHHVSCCKCYTLFIFTHHVPCCKSIYFIDIHSSCILL